MTQPLGADTAHDSAVRQIDDTTDRLNRITGNRAVPEAIAVGVLTAQSNLAIAAALLAIADAIHNTQPDRSQP